MERTYVIPLRKGFLKAPNYLRTNRAVKEVKIFLKRHMKTENIKLGEELNSALWARGDSKPPSRVTVLCKKEDDVVYAELVGKEFAKKDFSEEAQKKAVPKPPKAADKAKPAAPAQESAAEVIGKAASQKAKADAEKAPAAEEKKTE
jgi:large subunit ribosomal protein L31e